MGREIHRIHCRTHGGYFSRPRQPGRTPVACKPEYPCDHASNQSEAPAEDMPRKVAVRPVSRPEQVASAVKNRNAEERSQARKTRASAGGREATIAKATAAREQLEGVGWATSGKGWTEDDGTFSLTMTATRAEEMLLMTFRDGICVSSDYQLWRSDKSPAANGRPDRRLPFDPDEASDRELVQALSGCKVAWWNRLADKEEHAVVSSARIEITHHFDAHGEETPGTRMVRFNSHDGAGFHAFYVDQLIKIGK